MIVLVGLGNPGEKYSRHRHNIGFMAVDAIAGAHAFGAPRKKFQAEIREGCLKDQQTGAREKALIIKPQTYMNESGRAVRKAADFYKLQPSDFFVFYDELDLAPGKVRLKTGGGAAGHNGVRSIDAHLGNEFHRIRLGIGHPGDKAKVTNYVLGNFSKSDEDWLDPLLAAIAAAAPKLAVDMKLFSSLVGQSAVNQPTAKTAQQQASPSPPTAPNQSDDASAANPFAKALQHWLGRKK